VTTNSILLVDDEPADIQLAAELLKSSGYTVSYVADGFKALAACKVRMPDLIVLDVHMPIMSGVDVFNRLKVDEKTQVIPVIFTKSKESSLSEHDKKTLTNQHILPKPLEVEELIALTKTLIKGKSLTEEIKKKEGLIKDLSLEDPVTSLHNAYYLKAFLKTQLAQAIRYQHPVSLIVFEIDQGQEILKTYGQKGFDSILAQTALIIGKHNRKADFVSRSAEAEFTCVLSHTDKTGAIEVAEKLRNAITNSTLSIAYQTQTQNIPITVSMGISYFMQDMDDEGNTLLSNARAALEQAKSSGGNTALIAE
jgi:diguanylate cyclase (GGDEF)-like protein